MKRDFDEMKDKNKKLIEANASSGASAAAKNIQDQSEISKLRTQNDDMKRDLGEMKEKNKKLLESNATVGASFTALKEQAKKLKAVNEKMRQELAGSRGASGGKKDDEEETADVAKYKERAQKEATKNEKSEKELAKYKAHAQKCHAIAVKLEQQLKTEKKNSGKQVASRLKYQQAHAKISMIVSSRCSDASLVKDVQKIIDGCGDGKSSSSS